MLLYNLAMFKRKITKDIERWANDNSLKKKALVIKGLRQVGKTTTIMDYCRSHYSEIVYINFLDDPDKKELFEGNLTADSLLSRLRLVFPSLLFAPGKTVLFFDEVQECPRARYAAKPLMLDGRFDLIESGSLLGLRGYNRRPADIPVGFEHCLTMTPMDFEEFLWAKGVGKDVIEQARQAFLSLKPLDRFLNDVFLKYFREYAIVGGMPEAVAAYLTQGIVGAQSVQNDILESYKDDYGKHLNEAGDRSLDRTLLGRILDVYSSIPSQLSKENKKFAYSQVGKDGSARKYLDAILWLEEYGLISRCFNLKSLQRPLSGQIDDSIFKIFFNDTGLFMRSLGLESAADLLNGNIGIYKGSIYENLIADSLIKHFKDLYYYRKNDSLEIDFVTSCQSEITLLEVKANDGRAKSLKEVLTNKAKYNVTCNYKLYNGNVVDGDPIKQIPLYMVMFL